MLQTAVIQDRSRGDNAQPTYFAFISYKREDAKWALWLQKKLQNYRLPGSLLRGNKGLPKRLSPVFLDKLNLTPGELESSLREAVCDSKYLIVVCSRHTHDAPRYINDEIRYFLEGGNSPERIIPFIVDPSEEPEKECFPSMLQEILGEKNLLGVNIFDAGPRRAFIKVIARMHGLKTTELENSDIRRRRGYIVLFTALCLLLAAAAGLGINHYCIPHTAYYADYVQRRGVPEGIGKLTGDHLKYRANRYAITELAGRVVQLRYENAAGALQKHSHTEYTDRPTKAEYSYGAWGGLETVVCYNEFDQAVRRMEYSEDGKAIDLKEPDADYGGDFLRTDTGDIEQNITDTISDTPSGEVKKKDIVRYLVEYDDADLEIQRRYVSNPVYNTCTTDSHGVAGLRYEYDDQGRITRVENLIYSGRSGSAADSDDYAPGADIKGVCGKEYEYENYTIVRTEYFDAQKKPVLNDQGWMVCKAENDAWGNVIREEYLDAQNNLLLMNEGVAGFEMEYENGFLIRASYFGEDKEPVCRSGGFASMALKYDPEGNVIHEAYFGVDGELALNDYNLATADFEYENGKVTRAAYFGVDGKPVLHTDGNAGWTAQYDDRGREVRRMYFGVDGEPVQIIYGCAGVEYEYDADDNLTKCMYFGTDGQPLLQPEGYAGYVSEYENGNEVSCIYLDEEGLPVLQPKGYAGWEAEYNSRGYEVRRLYIGMDGAPVIMQYGYAGWESEYDENGNEVKCMFLGTDEKPLVVEGGYAGWERKYDANGNAVLQLYLGVDGEPVRHVDGNMGWIAQYDARGNETKRVYLGATLRLDGYAGAIREYDEAGNETKRMYLGEDEQPLMQLEGYAGWKRVYDASGNEIQRMYLGEDEQPLLQPEGNAGWRSEFDASGNETKRVFLDTNEQPILRKEGSAGWMKEYDEAGNETRRMYLGEDEQPLMQPEGYAGVKRAYDASGNEIQRMYLDENGHLLMQPEGYVGVKVAYDASGNVIQRMFLGEDEQPLMQPEGYAGWQSEYEASGNEILRVYLDQDQQPILREGIYIGWMGEYDAQGRILSKKFFNEEAEIVYIIRYEYDEAGNQSSNLYDAEGNLIS